MTQTPNNLISWPMIVSVYTPAATRWRCLLPFLLLSQSSQKHFTPPGWCIAKNSNINNKPPVQHNRHSLQHKTRAINHNRGIQSMRDKKRTRNHVRQQKLPTPEGKPLRTWNHSWETPQKPFFFLYRVLADDLHNSLLSQRKSSNYPTAHTLMFKNLILEDKKNKCSFYVHTHTHSLIWASPLWQSCVCFFWGGGHKSSVSCHENDMEEEK